MDFFTNSKPFLISDKISETFNKMIIDVSKENKGWDIEVIKRNKKFLIEVKGLSGGLKSIELSPNEYKNSTRKNFLLSVVYNALDDNKKIEIFEFNDNQNVWFSDKSVLKIVEKVSATLTVN